MFKNKMKILFGLFSLIYLCNTQSYEFPENFRFGVATAAYQIEGAWDTNGKGENIWDNLTHTNPDLIVDRSNGDIACDAYSHVSEDVQLLKDLGVDFYRFSFSWSRILPSGKVDYINPDGIRYYNELIDALLANDIQPIATLYHFDLPQPLEDEGGFLNIALADYFEDYANVLYENFGDRIKEWITFNEPSPICENGYGSGTMAPLIAQEGVGCYICSRTLLVAHARAYHLYNDLYKDSQGGRVGITINNFWYEPYDDSADTELALQVAFGWFAHPIYSEEGDFPPAMKERIARLSEQEGFVSSRLPELTSDEIELIKGSSDFFGFNFYTAHFCTDVSTASVPRPSHGYDTGVSCVPDFANYETAASMWLSVVPWGFRKMLNWIRVQYNNPEVIITENGFSDGEVILDDCRRINYYNSYLTELLGAIYEDGCNISGYTAWSFLDNFEWRSGFTERFGLYSVNFDDPERKRTPKMSTYNYKNIIQSRQIDWSYTPEGFSECEW